MKINGLPDAYIGITSEILFYVETGAQYSSHFIVVTLTTKHCLCS
jgi:hypothetical protein